MAKRYVTTLMGRLNKAEPVETLFDYGGKKAGVTKQQQIADALTFWEFYNSLTDHATGIKGLPEETDILRHEFLARVANENTLRGFVACWLRLPVTVIETLKWSQNLDIQSRESFLRRLLRSQAASVRGAYEEFFEHRSVPSCMRDGSYRKFKNRKVTYESLASESLQSWKRTESKSAISKDYGNMGFGHTKYPEGAEDDTTSSGASKTFFSVKNHENDFSVNKFDGLYWFLYRTLRSNYLWNRNAEVRLKPMICPGFWVTILSWAFFLVLSPVLALAVLFPLLAGNMGLTFYTFVGAVLGAVTPFLLLLYSVFYFFRDSRAIQLIGDAIDKHVDRFAKVWVFCLKTVVFFVFSIGVLLLAFILYVDPTVLGFYAVIPLMWIGAYWVKAVKAHNVFFPMNEPEKMLFLMLMAASFVLVLLPHTFGILGFFGDVVMAFVWLLANYPLQVLLLVATLAVALVVYLKTEGVRGYQTAYSGVTKQDVARDTQLLVGIVCVATCFYGAIVFWAFSSLFMVEGSKTPTIYPVGIIALVACILWFVLRDAFKVRKIDIDLVLKRNAYINALREKDLQYESYYMQLMDNNWVITQDDPVQAAHQVRSFVGMLDQFIYGKQSMYFQTRAAYTVDERAVKLSAIYTLDVIHGAYRTLGDQHFMEFALNALEGYTPEKALKKAQKLKSHTENKRSFWRNTLLVRMFVGFFSALGCAGAAVIKLFRDLLGMWHILHKYCPAVADTKQI